MTPWDEGEHGRVHPSPWAIKKATIKKKKNKASIKSEKITSAGKDVVNGDPCAV